MTVDWQAIRSEFPALQHWTFLNTATFGQLPSRAVQAVEQHFAHRDHTACGDFLAWFDDHDRLRAKIAQLVNCEASDVAYLPTASSALSQLLNGLDWTPGDEIVTLAEEFPNQIYHPSVLERNGVSLREVPLEALRESVTDRTRMILFSTANYVTGLRPPLDGLAGWLHDKGILLALDGTQSVGALRFDWRQLQPDFLAVDAYKWMLTPNGAGFAVIAPSLRERLRPQVIGWRSHKDWRDVADLHHGAPEFVTSAEKYEGGMLPSSLLYAMEAVVDLMLELGTDQIERRVLELAAKVRAVVRDLGGTLLYDKGLHYESSIVAARFASIGSAEIARALKDRKVLTSARHAYLRISTHFYNDEQDIHELRSALRDLL